MINATTLPTILYALCAGNVLAGPVELVSTNRYAPVIEKYTTLIEAEAQKLGIVGLGVALVDEHGPLWARAFGYEDLEKRIPATTETRFGIGSMTKVFTATAVLQLQARGALDIDQPMIKAIPEFKIKSRFAHAPEITPRHILTHHAGIPADLMASGEGEDFRSFLGAVGNLYTTFPPNYVDSYSNLGYCLLGSLIERVSHERFETFVEEQVFKPCGMKATRFNARVAGLERISRAYDEKKSEKVDDHTPQIPAGAIFSSIEDMTRFLRTWLNQGRGDNGVVLDAKMVDEMFRVQNRAVALDLGHGRALCWDAEDGEVGRVYSHGGALVCFRSQMIVAPECGLAAIMVVNTATGGGLTWRTKELVKEAARIKGVCRRFDPIPKAALVSLPAEEIPGTYAADFMHLTVTRKNSDLMAEINGATLRFLPTEGGAYKMQYQNGDAFSDIPGETYYFSEVNGQVLMIQEKWGSKNNAGAKIVKSPIPPVWRERLGQYQTTRESKYNWFQEAELTIQDDMLVMIVPITLVHQTAPFQLIVDDDQIAHVPGMNRYSGNVLECRKTASDSADLYFMGMPMKKK